jgi:hypothetical protein
MNPDGSFRTVITSMDGHVIIDTGSSNNPKPKPYITPSAERKQNILIDPAETPAKSYLYSFPSEAPSKNSLSIPGAIPVTPLDNVMRSSPKPAKNFKEPTNPPQNPVIPDGYVSGPTKNGNGIIYRVPGTTGNANTIQVYGPTKQYPNGYWKQYNNSGQQINPSTGKAASSKEDYHVPLPKK